LLSVIWDYVTMHGHMHIKILLTQFNELFLASCAQFIVGAPNMRPAVRVWPAWSLDAVRLTLLAKHFYVII